MSRKKGTPKTGGRQKGTPNKDNPLKIILREHSLGYFAPSIAAEDIPMLRDSNDNLPEHLIGKTFSEFDINLISMKAADRAKIEVELLSYHMPKMQAISGDMEVKTHSNFFTERLTRLSKKEDIPPDEE